MRSLRPFFFAVLAALACLSGCSRQAPVSTTAEAPPAPPAADAYIAACQTLEAAPNLMLTYTRETTRTVGNNRFTEAVSGTASLSNIGKADMAAFVEETLELGSYRCSYTETYAAGTAYANVNGCSFQAALAPADFAARQLPAALLEAGLYGSIRSETGPDTATVYFEDPRSLEAWAAPEGKLLEASGSAVLSSAGQLMSSQYTASYQRGSAVYETEVTLQVVAPKALDLSSKPLVPEGAPAALETLDAPKALLQVVGAVYSAQELTCRTQETIVSQALPLTYQQTDCHTLSGFGEDLWAEVEAETQLTDRRGQVSTKHQLEVFADGTLAVSVDNATPVENPQITAETMRQSCEDAILSGLFAPKYLQNAIKEETPGQYRLEFQGDEAFQADLMKNIASFLQTDLDAQADSFETADAGGYLVVDTATGLPTAMGLHFARTHILGPISYDLTYDLAQTLTFSLKTA